MKTITERVEAITGKTINGQAADSLTAALIKLCYDIEQEGHDAERERTKYNGWTNYETWNVKLWIDNDEGSYNYWREVAQEVWNDSTPGEYDWQTREQQFVYALADRMKDEFEENSPTETSGVYADLLGAALSSVNWHEIAEHYTDEIEKEAEEETEETEV